MELVNQSRAEAGAGPLAFDAELVAAAGKHSDRTVAQDVFSHAGADGSSAGGRMGAAGHDWTASGENIAYIAGSNAAALDAEDVERLHSMLLDFPGHRANILNADFGEIGIGLTQGDHKEWPAVFVTEDFGRPTESEAAEPDSWFV